LLRYNRSCKTDQFTWRDIQEITAPGHCHIQHDGTALNEYIPGTTDWELLDDLETSPTDIIISKNANDAFYNTQLQSRLSELNINELVITGSATDFCINATVQSALIKDYNTTVVKDGHTMSDRPNLKAEKLIEHYNWIWENLIPTRGKITIMSSEEIKKALAVMA
jgi:nicotinamidase-related amidase